MTVRQGVGTAFLQTKRSVKEMIKRDANVEDCDLGSFLGFEFQGQQASKAAAFFAGEGYETRANPDGTFLAVADPARGGVLKMCGLLLLAMEGLNGVTARLVPKIH